jgi:hypothetical protein
MRTKTLAWAALVAACLTLARPGAAGTRADELQLSIVEAQTSATQITVQWTQPHLAPSVNFLNYELMRGDLVPASALSLAGLAALVAGLFTAGIGLRTRRRSVAGGGLALALLLPAGFQALGLVKFTHLQTIALIGTTTYTDTTVQAGKGYFYKVIANLSDSSMQSSPPQFGAAIPPAPLSDSPLVVRFEQGPDPNSFTLEDGVILDPNTTSVKVSGCIAPDPNSCGGVLSRGGITGDLFVNQTKVNGSNINGSFTQSVALAQGPNFVHMTGTNSSGKTITLARTYSLGELRLSGALIQKAIGVVVSPKPATGMSLLDKLKQQINDQTPADWNEIFGKLKYPRVIHIQNSSATLDITITNAHMTSGGGIVARTLELAQQSPNKAIFTADLSLVNLDISYSVFDASFQLGLFAGNTCPVNGPPGRIHLGNIRVRATFTLSLESGNLFVSLTQFNGAPVIQDASGDFDTQRLIGGPECNPLFTRDLDAQLLTAISDQAATVFNHIEFGSASINDVPLGTSGLKADLAISELSQDPNTGLVIRFDAGVKNSGPSQVSFPLTDNPPPDSRNSTGGVFPGAFPSAADAGFTLSDDLINESVAAAQSQGLLTGAIIDHLQIGGNRVPLSVAGLDPSADDPNAYVPNLRLHAPPEAPVRIAITYITNPVAGLRSGAGRAQGGLRLLQTGLVADVLVDTDLNGIFDPVNEKALTLDLDVLSTSDVVLQGGAVHFTLTTPVRGYTVSPGFLSVPHASLNRLAEAIIDDRITRLLDVLNGIGGAGLVIPGLSFTTLDAVADGGTAAPYKDTLTAWGASSIDLKTLIESFLDRINPPAP